jgi:FtsP/CotA-like multicopper oxidase with cupredoxin domain
VIRRIFLWSLAVVSLAAIALGAAGYALFSTARTNTVGDLRFANELAIPPLLEPREEGRRKIFELTVRVGHTPLLPGKPAQTRGVNGSYLGPTLRAARGDRVALRVRNELPEATTIHWHGMHLPAVADGGPHQLIDPGETWTPSWTIEQPAATLWYHPHPHGQTAEHVYRGISGLFLLDDAQTDRLSLPREYGADDIPLVVQDKRLHDDGSLDFSQAWISPTGRLGDTILVNGTYDPYVEIRHQRVRFRLLNASAARVYNIGFADNRHVDLVGTDGGLLEAPYRTERILLSPGERAEIVASFRPGERVVLRSFAPELGTNFWEKRFAGGDDSFDLLQVRAAAELDPSPDVPIRLAAHRHLYPEDALRTRRFELDGRSINGADFEMSRIDEVVEAASVEIWEVRNASGTPHNFHPHGVSFRVLDYDGSEPRPALAGWKDTIYAPPGKTLRLLVRFGDYPNSHTPYMFHCHLLEHEDRGMMGQYILVRRSGVSETDRTSRRSFGSP